MEYQRLEEEVLPTCFDEAGGRCRPEAQERIISITRIADLVREATPTSRTPYLTCLIVGLGGLFAGVTGPLLSTFVPLLVRDALGDHRTQIGGVMAIDNILLLILVPWAGAVSDRSSAGGRSRLPLVITGFVLASAGMAVLPASAPFGIGALIGAMVLLYSGINIQRSPFHALVADLVPSRYRSLAMASVMFQMCVGAIVFLMLGRMLGMRPAFQLASGAVLVVAIAFAAGLRQHTPSSTPAAESTFRSMFDAVWAAARGLVPGLRAIFVASLLLQMIFQSFTTWFALHGTERFGVRPEDIAIGFIAWALGGVIGALPAGAIGIRIGRRNAMMLGFGLMLACFVALDRVTRVEQAVPLLALASASWTFPTVNAYPLFIEQIPRHHRGVLAAIFLLCMALGGAIGDPLNGRLFDAFDAYRPLFLMMAVYTALAFVAVLCVPRGAGETSTGPDRAPDLA
jgi:maltose/moltooligosaccharide transporter